MKRVAVLVVLSSFLVGCAASSSSYGNRSRTFEVSYDSLYESTIGYLMERGFDLAKSSSQTGDFETEYRDGAGWGTKHAGDKRARVIGKVTSISENESKLSMTIISEERDLSSGWQEVMMNFGEEQIYYKNYFDAIEARAKLKNQ